MEVAVLLLVLLASRLTFLTTHCSVVYLKDFELAVTGPRACRIKGERDIPPGIKTNRKDSYCILHCAQHYWCEYVHQNGSTCFFYDTQFRPSVGESAGVVGYKHPRVEWQPPTEIIAFWDCIYATGVGTAEGHRHLKSIMFQTRNRQNFTDCFCVKDAQYNWVALNVGGANLVTSITVTTSFGNDSVLLKNTNIHVGNTTDYNVEPIVATLSDTPEEYTDQVFNVSATGQFVVLHRNDSTRLCLCHIQAMGLQYN